MNPSEATPVVGSDLERLRTNNIDDLGGILQTAHAQTAHAHTRRMQRLGLAGKRASENPEPPLRVTYEELMRLRDEIQRSQKSPEATE